MGEPQAIVSPQSVGGAQSNPPYSATQQSHKGDVPNMSRHETPLATVEQSPVQEAMPVLPPDEMHHLTNGGDYGEQTTPQQQQSQGGQMVRPATNGANAVGGPGVFRRARSATMLELGPYPQKSHSCPIPTCGRLFKRLEHLKR